MSKLESGPTEKDLKMTGVNPEKPNGSFGDLVELAETIQLPPEPEKPIDEPATPPAQSKVDIDALHGEALTMRGKEKAKEMEDEKSRMAIEQVKEVMARQDQFAYDSGRDSYKVSATNPQSEENRDLSMRLGLRHGYMSFGSATFRHPSGSIDSPQGYLETFDALLSYEQGRLSEAKSQPDITPEEFLTIYGEEPIARFHSKPGELPYLAHDPKNAMNMVRYKDLATDPKFAFDLFSRNFFGPNNNKRSSELFMERAQKALQGFAEAAMRSDDIATTLESFKRLGKMDDPEVVASVKASIEKLRNSENPKDQEKLRRGIEKIKELAAK